ncbi:MAG: hypothetical protein MZW92_02320 [Comamonadaceae bacterium]|nr:hypothetical protein [Comamonadaceae bacterium]
MARPPGPSTWWKTAGMSGAWHCAGLVDRRRPRLHLFGHIHQAFGIEGTSVNGAYPHSRKFFAVDSETLEVRPVE